MQQCMKLTDTNRSRACSQAAAEQQLGKDRKAIVCGQLQGAAEVRRMKSASEGKKKFEAQEIGDQTDQMYAVLNVLLQLNRLHICGGDASLGNTRSHSEHDG